MLRRPRDVEVQFFAKDCIGKYFKPSKKRYTWKLTIDEHPHCIQIYISEISGKRKMLLDGEVKYTGKAQTGIFFQFPFKLEGHSFCVVQTESEWDLKIDNFSFSRLKMNERGSRMDWDTEEYQPEATSHTDPGTGFRPHPDFLQPPEQLPQRSWEAPARSVAIKHQRPTDFPSSESLPNKPMRQQGEMDLLDLSGPTQVPPGSKAPTATFSSKEGLSDVDFFSPPVVAPPQNNPFLVPAVPGQGNGMRPPAPPNQMHLRPGPIAHPFSAGLLMQAYANQQQAHRNAYK